MKKITIITLIFLVSVSCSNMESDSKKACELMTEVAELIPETMQLGMKTAFGDEESKKEAQGKLDEIEANLESMQKELEDIKKKYDEDEFQAYLLDNCETAKNLKEMGDALQGLDDSIDNN